MAVSSVGVAYVDEAATTIGVDFIDAFPGSPVLDVKPYVPSADRVESPSAPAWYAHWSNAVWPNEPALLEFAQRLGGPFAVPDAVPRQVASDRHGAYHCAVSVRAPVLMIIVLFGLPLGN